MDNNQLDFNKISKALKDTYMVLDGEGMNLSLSEANENYLNALSHATLVDKEWLKYIKD